MEGGKARRRAGRWYRENRKNIGLQPYRGATGNGVAESCTARSDRRGRELVERRLPQELTEKLGAGVGVLVIGRVVAREAGVLAVVRVLQRRERVDACAR